MWTYAQATGALFAPDGTLETLGYSGWDDGKNNPAAQNEPNIGPIPCGVYTIKPAQCIATPGPHGPFVLPLAPDASNVMHGRSGFLIHGDSIAHIGDASHGCIILPRTVRERIAASGDNRLTVVPDVVTA